ncbi:tripartite motif-containing protein 16-like, partial [Limanda limanda]|uniref:tripartite motif-containing protein 16-like n=1 Tax=Limanda limanda TaxID=27771 RepID=UPI0029C8CB64
RRQTIQQRVQDTEKDLKLLQQEEEALNGSADKAVEDSEEIFTELIRLLEKRSSDVEQQIRSQQETEVSRVKELQERLEQEITELKRKDHELKQLSDTEDHNQFLHSYPSLSPLSESTHSSSFRIRPLRNFEDVTAAVSQVRGQLQDILSETETQILQIVSQVDVLLRQPEPETRADFLRYSQEITLDPNTVYRRVLLSEGNRQVTCRSEGQPYSDYSGRFPDWCQVLSRESLTGRCYWEVESDNMIWRRHTIPFAFSSSFPPAVLRFSPCRREAGSDTRANRRLIARTTWIPCRLELMKVPGLNWIWILIQRLELMKVPGLNWFWILI